MTDPLHILVIGPLLPLHDRDSGSLRMFRLLRLLAEDGHRLTFIARTGDQQDAYVRDLEELGIDVHPGDPARARERGLGARGELDVAAILDRGRFDVAWIAFFEVAEQYLPIVRRHSPGTRVVIDTVDVHHVREERAAALDGGAAEREAAARTRAREAAIYAQADALLAVTDADADALRALAPDVPVSIVPNVHDMEGTGPGFGERHGLVFVGNFLHTPNADAVLHFHAGAWQRLRRLLPGLTLTIVGNRPPPAVTELAGDGVEVTGWVPDVGPYLDRARIAIAPMRFGAGVKGKIGDALARGVPVVTSSIGAEGMGLLDGEHALVADAPDAFASAAVRLHEDPELWSRLLHAGRGVIDATLGSAAARSALRDMLSGVAPATFQAPVGEDLDEVLGSYVASFAPDDRVSLALTVDDPGPAALHSAFAAVGDALGRLGHGGDDIPDVVVTHWPAGAPVPHRVQPARPGAFATDATVAGPAGPSTPVASLHLRLSEDPAIAAGQVAAVSAAGLGPDVELLASLVAPAQEVERLLAELGARVLRSAGPVSRSAAVRHAARLARADVVVTLGPHALPRPGFLAPLVDAVEGGSVLAGPVVDGARGFRLAGDGGLLPRAEGDEGAPDALAFDCLAARASWFAGELPATSSREGHAEVQIATVAAARGAVTVCDDAVVDRLPALPASVVICTRDRAGELPGCVAALVAEGATRGDGEILIVDNASSDATADVVAGLTELHGPRVRLVHEPRGGLGHARNAGADAARHDLLLYVDDDARPAPGWLSHLTHGLARPGVVNAGGPIAALWPQERPDGWPEPGLEAFLSVLDLGDADLHLAPPHGVYGANWAVRRSAMRSVGGFDPAFGPGPRARINGDEVSVARRLHRSGAGLTRFVAEAAVGHRIAPGRVDDRFLLERSLCVGIERPRHDVALDGVQPEKLVAAAGRAARRLLGLVPLSGERSLEQALREVGAAPLGMQARVVAADALGELAGAALLLGEREAHVGDLRLALRPEHLSGVLEPVAPAAAPADAQVLAAAAD